MRVIPKAYSSPRYAYHFAYMSTNSLSGRFLNRPSRHRKLLQRPTSGRTPNLQKVRTSRLHVAKDYTIICIWVSPASFKAWRIISTVRLLHPRIITLRRLSQPSNMPSFSTTFVVLQPERLIVSSDEHNRNISIFLPVLGQKRVSSECSLPQKGLVLAIGFSIYTAKAGKFHCTRRKNLYKRFRRI